MRRRQFIAGLGSAAAWPVAARAQLAGIPVIGYLSPGTPEEGEKYLAAFRKGLSEIGYVEGRNVALEYRWANNDFGRMPELAADLVRRRVAVIATRGAPATLVAQAETKTIPVVFVGGVNPSQTGLVTSLNRPGGNITGVTTLSAELLPKRLDLLRELVPHSTHLGALLDPVSDRRSLEAAAAVIGRPIDIVEAGSARDIETAFAQLVQKGVDALPVDSGVLFFDRRVQITTLALYHRLPAIYADRSFPEAGGLMSYGTNLLDIHRQVGVYSGRILKGEKPSDLPVQQPTKFELVINLQTARLLHIEVPSTLLATADEVIQ
jgi:putative tryptophan/tyrosine transport system substrate-binding protein